MVKGFKKLSYRERLIRLGLPTLKFRRIRGDMVEVFKIITGKYDLEVSPVLPLSLNTRTRGNLFKLETERAKYGLRKFSFSSRVVGIWNTLPDDVLVADSVNSFKNRLDRLWRNEKVY